MPTESPYATHLPVLAGLCADVTRVLELGAGTFSTPFFLELPKLRKLISLETSPEWFSWVKEHFKSDKLDIRLVDSIPKALQNLKLDAFDLVFVDNGENATERGEVIRAVLTQPHPLVVIHDAEVYGGLIDELAPDREIHRDLEPWTAVIPRMSA